MIALSPLQSQFAASPFPASLRFRDIEPVQLAREAVPPATAAWPDFLRRMLPPVMPDATRMAGAPATLRTPRGMADFLLTMGPHAARQVSDELATHGPAFWGAVSGELELVGAVA